MKILVDAAKCSGCRYCELVCSFRHEKKFNSKASRIIIIKEDKQGLDYPITCRQCEPCVCIETCPTEALIRTISGTIQVLQDKCVKCDRCIEVCPFGAVRKHPENNFPIICNLCGGKPLCVQKCPTGALEYADPKQKAARKGRSYAKNSYKKYIREWKMNGH